VSERTVYFFDLPISPRVAHPTEDPLGHGDTRSFPFRNRLEIGRYQEGRRPTSEVLLIDDATVSRRHCVLTRTADGRCFLRDTSRNGTWVDGRRLVPNVEVEIQNGHVIGVAQNHLFVLEGCSDPAAGADAEDTGDAPSVARPRTS